MHTYTDNKFSSHLAATVLGARRLYNKAHVKIAVSEASRWTQERFYGGRYRIIPNGVDIVGRDARARSPSPTTCGCCSSAAPRSARACPSRCAPSRRCAATGVDARLTVAGSPRARRSSPTCSTTRASRSPGRVSDDEKWRLMHESDLLVAPVARRRELRHGADGGVRLRHAGRRLRHRGLPRRRHATASTACSSRPAIPPRSARRCTRWPSTPSGASAWAPRRRRSAERFAWPHVAAEVMEAYEDAIELAAAPSSPRARASGSRCAPA